MIVGAGFLVAAPLSNESYTQKSFYYASYLAPIYFLSMHLHIRNAEHMRLTRSIKSLSRLPSPPKPGDHAEEPEAVPEDKPTILKFAESDPKSKEQCKWQICGFLALFGGIYLRVFRKELGECFIFSVYEMKKLELYLTRNLFFREKKAGGQVQ